MTNVINMKGKSKSTPDLSNNVLNEPFEVYGSAAGYFSLDAINQARAGMSMQYLLNLGKDLALSLQEMGQILHLSLRTLQRYTPTKMLDTDASAKLLQLNALRQHGVQVFENEENFNKWLRTPSTLLENQKPIEMLDTPYGFQLVDQLLGRIEYGIFA